MTIEDFEEAMQQNLKLKVLGYDHTFYEGMSYDLKDRIILTMNINKFWIEDDLTIEIYV